MENVCYGCFRPLTTCGPCPNCGFAPSTDRARVPQALRYGTLLGGRYRSGRILAQDALGLDYLARDEQTGFLVNLREYNPLGLADRREDQSLRPSQESKRDIWNTVKSTFAEEYRRLAQLSDTPQLIQTYRVFEEYGTVYAALERDVGEPLSQRIVERGAMSCEEVERSLVPLMGAISEIHGMGMLHGGIRPEQVFIRSDGSAKLGGFSMANIRLGQQTGNLGLMVHPGFSPLEQYPNRGQQGEYSDVYAFASVLCFALTGKIIPAAPTRIQETRWESSLPPQLVPVMKTALALHPEERFQTISAFQNALTSTMKTLRAAPQIKKPTAEQAPRKDPVKQGGAQSKQTQVPKPSVAPRPSAAAAKSTATSHRPLILVLCVLLLLSAGAIVYLLMNGKEGQGSTATAAATTSETPEAAAESQADNAVQPIIHTPKPTATSKPTATPNPTAKPTPSPEPTEDPRDSYLLPDSATRYLTDEDLAPLTAEECCFARNEIFARHGRIFKTPEIADYFASKTWYHGTVAPERFDDKVFNEIERANIQFIQAYESAHWGGSYY